MFYKSDFKRNAKVFLINVSRTEVDRKTANRRWYLVDGIV